MKQIFESNQISFVEVSEYLVNDYLIMVNDDEHVGKHIHGRIGSALEPYTMEQEYEWIRKTLESKAVVFSMLEKILIDNKQGYGVLIIGLVWGIHAIIYDIQESCIGST